MRRRPSPKQISETTGAIAGLSIAVAAAAQFLAWIVAPTGIAFLLIAVGAKNPSLAERATPIILIICTLISVIAGISRFYA